MALETLNTTPPVPAADTETEAPLSVATKPAAAASKNPYLQSLPSATSAGALSPEILKNLQDMITEREKRKVGLNEAMRDATAWWSGGAAGPGEALRARAAEREGQDATTFGMKSQLAQYNAAAASAANRAKSLRSELGGGAPGAPGAAPTGGSGSGMPPNVANEINRLLSLDPPDVATAEALRNTWAKNESKFEAGRHTQGTYFINGENVNLTPDEYATYKATGRLPGQTAAPAPAVAPTTSQALPHTKPIEKVSAPTGAPVQASAPTASGVNAFNVGNVRPAGSSTGFQQPKDMSEGLSIMDNNLKAYGDKGINTLAGVINRWAPPSENDTAAYIKSAAQRLGISPDQPIDLSNPAVRQAVGTAIMLQEKGPKNIFASAPAQNVPLSSQRAEMAAVKTTAPSNAGLPYPTPRNSEEVKANQEFIKKRSEKELEVSSKGPEKASTEAGTRQAQMFKLNEDADKAIEAADIVIAASKSHPESVGLGQGFTGSNIATTAIGMLPKMDQHKAEERYSSFALSPEALAARSQVDTASKQLGISFAADVFKGARMGIGLENMAAGAKGVSTSNLAENNLINATLIKEAAIFNKARAKLFKEWAPANGGRMADFEQFETSPEYNALKAQTQQKLVDSLPNYLKMGKEGLVAKDAKEEKPASKFDKFKKKKED